MKNQLANKFNAPSEIQGIHQNSAILVDSNTIQQTKVNFNRLNYILKSNWFQVLLILVSKALCQYQIISINKTLEVYYYDETNIFISNDEWSKTKYLTFAWYLQAGISCKQSILFWSKNTCNSPNTNIQIHWREI